MREAPVAVIASLYPAQLGPVRRASYSPQPNYEIPACTDLNVPQILVVRQQYEHPYMGLDRTALRTWEGYEVADDVLGEMVRGLPGTNGSAGAEAGAWVSAGAHFDSDFRIHRWVIPQAEIDEHRPGLDLTLRRLILIAREFHAKGAGQSIIPIMHKAAEFLRISGEAWQQVLTSDARDQCPFCKAIVEMDAEGFPPMCGGCKNVLNQARFDRVRQSIQRFETSIEGTDFLADQSEDPGLAAALTPRQRAAAKKAELTTA